MIKVLQHYLIYAHTKCYSRVIARLSITQGKNLFHCPSFVSKYPGPGSVVWWHIPLISWGKCSLYHFYLTTWMFHNASGKIFYGQMRQKWNILAQMHNIMFGGKRTLYTNTKMLTVKHGLSIMVLYYFAVFIEEIIQRYIKTLPQAEETLGDRTRQ